MSATNQVRFVDRVQFFQGQRLLADDLQALEEYQREMRWLHNRSLHQPGVASGLAVRGEKGDSSLLIEPGYAIDVLGRELILSDAHVEPVPPVAGDGAGNPVAFDLTVSYPARLEASERRGAVCEDGDGAVRLREEPVFCWVRVGASDAQTLRQQIETGERILLARVQVLQCQLHQPVSIAQRKNAKPAVHPFVHAEIVDVVWVKDETPSPFGLRLTTAKPIDTRAAGFRTSPAYFVNLLEAQSIRIQGEGGPKDVPLDAFLEVTHVLPESFEVALLIPRMLFDGSGVQAETVFVALLEQLKGGLRWRIEWLGVEG